MLYSRFFKSLKPPLYVGLEVDTQQLNVPNRNITFSKFKNNRTYIVLSYFIQVIESISIHRFVPIFRKHVKLRPHENINYDSISYRNFSFSTRFCFKKLKKG